MLPWLTQALLVNHARELNARELNARTQKYTAHERKVAPNLYHIHNCAINPKLHGYKCLEHSNYQ